VDRKHIIRNIHKWLHVNVEWTRGWLWGWDWLEHSSETRIPMSTWDRANMRCSDMGYGTQTWDQCMYMGQTYRTDIQTMGQTYRHGTDIQTWDRHTDMGQTYRHGDRHTDVWQLHIQTPGTWDRYTYRHGIQVQTWDRYTYKHGTHVQTWVIHKDMRHM
jgi:hypothetical protein